MRCPEGGSCFAGAAGWVILPSQRKGVLLLSSWELPESYDFEGREIRWGRLGDGPPMVVVHGTPWSSFKLRRFSKIILIDPVAISPWGLSFFRHVQAHEAAFAGLPDYIHDAVVRAYVQTAAFDSLDEATLDGIVLPWTGEKGKAAFYRQMAQADSKYTDEAQPLYHTITTPTLILWGREDSWIPLERGERLHEMIPDSTLRVIDGAGHLVIEEKPGELVKEILEFAQT